MIGTVLANILRFVLLVLIQVLILDHVNVANGYMAPYLYVLFVLMLPFETPIWAVLVLGALIGLTMDVFSNTLGMHMSATVVLAYLRHFWLRVLAPRDGYEFGLRPSVHSMGLTWTVAFFGPLIAAHHIWLFVIEVFRTSSMGGAVVRAVLSTVMTLALCLLAQYLTGRSDRARK